MSVVCFYDVCYIRNDVFGDDVVIRFIFWSSPSCVYYYYYYYYYYYLTASLC